MKNIVAKKEFWNHLKFDKEKTSVIKSAFVFNKFQFDKIRSGCIPDDIAQRFLAYYENNTLFIHSLMGGDCYYELNFQTESDRAFCIEIKKYTTFRSTDNEQETINVIKSFIQYSITQESVDDFASD